MTDSPSVILALSKGLTKIALNSHVTMLLIKLLMPTGSRVFTLESLFYRFYLFLFFRLSLFTTTSKYKRDASFEDKIEYQAFENYNISGKAACHPAFTIR